MTDLTDEQGAAKRQKLDHLVDVNGSHAEADGNQEGFASATAIQEELQKLAEEESARINEIALEFKGRRKEVYERRSKVLASIKGFWLTVLEHSSIREYVNDYDKAILEYLTSLDVYDDDANSSFTIALSFKANPFFSNKVLTRTSTRISEDQTGVSCSEVNWKDGQDLQHFVNEEDGEPLIHSYTFLNWFTSEGVYDEGAEDGGDQIAYIIRGDIWEHPLELFDAEYEEQPEGEGDEEGNLQAHVEGEEAGEEEDADADEDDPDEGFEEDGSDEDEVAVDDEEDEDEQDAL